MNDKIDAEEEEWLAIEANTEDQQTLDTPVPSMEEAVDELIEEADDESILKAVVECETDQGLIEQLLQPWSPEGQRGGAGLVEVDENLNETSQENWRELLLLASRLQTGGS